MFVEARGGYILSNGSTDSKPDGAMTSGTQGTYKLSNAGGIAGGVTVGYELAKSLAGVLSFDYRSASSRQWSSTNVQATSINSALNAGTVDSAKLKSVKNTMVVGLGLRPSVEAWGGTIYAGAGVALLLPYSDEVTLELTGYNPGVKHNRKLVATTDWNLGIGVYGELGYNYNITDSLYVGVGVRALVVTSNNDGKSKKTDTTITDSANTVFVPNGTSSSTTNYSTSLTGAANEAAYKSDGTTDIGFNINVGFRF